MNLIHRIRKYFLKGTPPPPIEGEKLRRFFETARLELLDVGARGGPLKELDLIAPFSRLFLCEPEQEEAELLKRSPKLSRWRSVKVIPEALGFPARRAELQITRYEGLSSLFQPNPEEISKFFPSSGAVFRKESKEAWEVVRSTSVPVVTLDEAARKYGFRECAFLKLDTQGTELEILRSGEGEVLPGVASIYLEAEEVPFYKNQPLFADLYSFLGSRGFRMLDLKRTFRRRAEKKAGWSKPELIYVHALFFREYSRERGAPEPLILHRAAALALAFKFFDYAIWLCERPSFREYLCGIGCEGVEKEIVSYADRAWKRMLRTLPKESRRRLAGDGYQDKTSE